MKVYNITPRKKRINRVKQKYEVNKDVELLEFNMTEGSNLKFEQSSKDTSYFKVNLNFSKHCMSRILCLN